MINKKYKKQVSIALRRKNKRVVKTDFKDNKYKVLQIIIGVLGFAGTTTLSFMYISPWIYILAMYIFGVYNILQTIHFKLRKMYIFVAMFIYFFVIGLYGYVKFILQNFSSLKIFP